MYKLIYCMWSEILKTLLVCCIVANNLRLFLVYDIHEYEANFPIIILQLLKQKQKNRKLNQSPSQSFKIGTCKTIPFGIKYLKKINGRSSTSNTTRRRENENAGRQKDAGNQTRIF